MKLCWQREQESSYCPPPIYLTSRKAPNPVLSPCYYIALILLALMMTQKIDIIPDDMSITRGLLGRPDIPPRRRTSFTSSARSAHTGNISNELEESINIKEDGGRRRMIQSSNTWTTSSGEILSEQDDIEDRIFFILEYNRLATKVSCCLWRRILER